MTNHIIDSELLERLAECAETANRTKYAEAVYDLLAQPAQWWIPVSERLPEVEKGKHKFVLVSVYRARSQRSFVFMLTFANEYEVQNDGYIDGDTEYAYLSGWYDTNDEGDFFPFVKYDEADELTHWMPLPAAPEVKP